MRLSSHFDYYSHVYSTLGLDLCCYEVVVDFEKPELVEAVDIEEVLYTKMVDVGIKPQRHMDMGSMEYEPQKLEIDDEQFP